MKNKKTDLVIRELLKKSYTVPPIVTQRIDESLEALPQLTREKNRNPEWLYKIYRRKLVSGFVAMMILASALVTTPIIAENYTVRQAKRHEAYVIHEGYYYVATGKELPQSKLGNQIAEVKRAGDWNIKQNGDSNHFVPSSPIYEVTTDRSEEYIAVQSTLFNYFTTYIELVREDPVQQPDPDTILSAKNEPSATDKVLDNLQNQDVGFYAFPDNFDRVDLDLADYDPDKGITLFYRVPEADMINQNGREIQGFLFIYQYKRGDEELFPNSKFSPKEIIQKTGENTITKIPNPEFTPPQAVETFTVEGIKWSYYSNELMRGQKGNMLYEVQTQGNFSKDLLTDLISNFKENEEIKL